jgi:uncharacterized membrane protein (DUF485 family)
MAMESSDSIAISSINGNIIKSTNELNNLISEWNTMNLNSAQFSSFRQSIWDSVLSKIHSFRDDISKAIIAAVPEQTHIIQGIAKKAQLQVVEALKSFERKGQSEISTLQSELERLIKQSSDLQEKSKEALKSTSIASQAELFRNTGNWRMGLGMALTVIGITALSVFAWQLYQSGEALATYVPKGKATAYLANKIALSAVTLTIVFAIFKVSRALIHQGSLYSYRAQALSTFDRFYRSSDDPEIQKRVLEQMAKTIFTDITSGLEGGAQGKDGDKLVEVIQKAGRPG